MYPKNFNVFIQQRFSKLILINGFSPSSDKLSLLSSIEPLNKLFLCKLDVCIAKSKEEHF